MLDCGTNILYVHRINLEYIRGRNLHDQLEVGILLTGFKFKTHPKRFNFPALPKISRYTVPIVSCLTLELLAISGVSMGPHCRESSTSYYSLLLFHFCLDSNNIICRGLWSVCFILLTLRYRWAHREAVKVASRTGAFDMKVASTSH